MTAELVAMGATDARTLTDRIKTGVDAIWSLIERAYLERAWDALGYSSWDDYCTREFGTSRLRLPREERPEVVASLRESGMSIRAIAAATGMSHGAIGNEVSKNGHLPDDERATTTYDHGAAFLGPGEEIPITTRTRVDIRTGEVIDERPITGLDGKQYRPRPVVDPAPPPKTQWSGEEESLREQLEHGQTVVVSLRGAHNALIEWADAAGLYVRIDRRSDWGNPFVTPGDGDRGEVIANFETHYIPYKPSLLERLDSLRGKALGCWCAPEPCHGDVLKKLADS